MNGLSQFGAAPNLLTLMRLFLIPFLVIAILDGHLHWAFVLFLVAGLSDALDGLLARLLKQHTRLGQYLDPIADKMLLSTLFVVFTHVGVIPRYVTVLVFSRDVGILLISTLLYVTNTLRDFRPSLFGKLNTLTQILAVIVVMCGLVFGTAQLADVRVWLLRAITVLAPLSAAQYAWIVVRRVQSQEEAAQKQAAT